jgi:hypothetical protein
MIERKAATIDQAAYASGDHPTRSSAFARFSSAAKFCSAGILAITVIARQLWLTR